MVLPKEHGTWMMFFLPVILGVFLSAFHLMQIPYLVGSFFLYLASTPFFNIIRHARAKKEMLPWLVRYMLVAAIFLLPVIYGYPQLINLGVLAIPFLAVNCLFAIKKNERNLWNDLSGIVIFSLGGAGAFYIGAGEWTEELWQLFCCVFLYFTGSVFYVKSLIREQKNRSFSRKSHLVHACLLFVPLLLGKPWMVFAFVPGVAKDWLTRRERRIKPLYIGITEIINGCIFLLLSLVSWNM